MDRRPRAQGGGWTGAWPERAGLDQGDGREEERVGEKEAKGMAMAMIGGERGT